MKKDYIEDFLSVKPPKRSGWECELFGAGKAIIINPERGKVPNWFWRKMQYLLVGNKWNKIK